MKLASLLNSNLIFLDAKVGTKQDAIRTMVNAVHREFSFELEKDDIFDQVMEREKQGVTTLKNGISIPHIRMKMFNDFILSFLIPSVPIEENGIKIRMIVLIIASHSSPHLHLNTLSAMAQLGDNKELYEALLHAQNTHDFIQIFDKSDFRVKKELLVQDIMSQVAETVNDSATIKEVVNIFHEKNTSYITVVDAHNKIVGEISILDIIGKGIPDYALQLDNISFLSTMGAFEDLLKNEDKISVKEIMRLVTDTLSPELTFLEAAYLIVKSKKRHIPVVQDGEVKGLVSFMDILNKVLRG